jgi:hypothetical protein
MPESKRLLAFLACFLFAAGLLVAQGPKAEKKDKDEPPKAAAPGAIPKVGEIIPDYTFKNFISGDGRASMKDFRGSVVLVDWWGMH